MLLTDNKLSFTKSTYLVDEDDGQVELVLVLHYPLPSQLNVTLNHSTNGTAQGNLCFICIII